MFLYNFASLMLAILCLEYVLNDSLGHRNPRNDWEWRNSAQNKGTWASTKHHANVEVSCIHNFDFVHTRLTLRMWAMNKKNPSRLT